MMNTMSPLRMHQKISEPTYKDSVLLKVDFRCKVCSQIFRFEDSLCYVDAPVQGQDYREPLECLCMECAETMLLDAAIERDMIDYLNFRVEYQRSVGVAKREL